jgi:hypothetical protein
MRYVWQCYKDSQNQPPIGTYLEDITHLFPHLPHALHTAEQVAAPQQLATTPNSYDYQ